MKPKTQPLARNGHKKRITYAVKLRPETVARIPALCARYKVKRGQLIEAAIEQFETEAAQ